jgi:hypothetical protein
MSNQTETLEDLERAVVIGQRALTQRNKMLVELANEGHSSASLYHRLNAVRLEEGAQALSRDAIHIAIRRGRKDTTTQ